MRKGDTGTGIIAYTEFPDKGYILTDEGERIEIKHAIPGQNVEFVVTKKRKGKLEGRVLRVIEVSHFEDATSPCIHFRECGGCLYQTIGYENQLLIKEEQMKRLLTSADSDSFIWEGILPSPTYLGYRNKMEFSFGDTYKGGPLALGMHKRGGHYDIVDVKGCMLVESDVRKIREATLIFFRERQVTYFHKNSHSGFLRHLLIRRSTYNGDILVDLVTTSSFGEIEDPYEVVKSTHLGKDSALEKCGYVDVHAGVADIDREVLDLITAWKDMILGISLEGNISGVLHTINNSYADAVINQGTKVYYGTDFLVEKLHGLTFKITPFSFFQTNTLGAEILYHTAGSYMGDTKGKSVFDLYSGTGTIAQLLAGVADEVYGVEIIEEAVVAARENAKLNGLSNCTFLAGDVLKVIDELDSKPDIIVLDPPREGINPKALPKIIGYGTEKIIYISCKPTSYVRDLEILKEAGYRMEKACAVDMFPYTPNCELVVSLHKIS